ncbi:hypothetical protein HPB51_028930 [Rhipicephalus microplus]|uniref:POLO box domain-containing protein n=1 Tax=Rhipicephalus microplus TaxID=6941 RepID=A0A9J6CVK5_RHIMP|nr:hypothetical protein HPB51_028930 [Rhipicephalus microplus]
MPVVVVCWDVYAVSNSVMAFAISQTGILVAIHALDALAAIKVPRRDRLRIALCGVAFSSGPQAALNRILAGTTGNLRLISRGVGGRKWGEGHSATGSFGAGLADDYLLTIKASLRVVRSAGIAFWITLLHNGPQGGLATSRVHCRQGLRACTLVDSLFQTNFFQSHTKLILCPLMAAGTYVDNNRTFDTARLETPQRLPTSVICSSRRVGTRWRA